MLSLIGFQQPIVNTATFFLIGVLTFVLSLRFPFAGLCIVATEIVIGSFGYLFYFQVHDTRISVRIAIFAAVFLAWLIRRFRFRTLYFFKNPLIKPIIALGIIVSFGILLGIAHGNGLSAVFNDANSYLFFLLLLVISDIVFSKNDFKKLFIVISAACTWVIIKTYLVLVYFSHVSDESLIKFAYRWLRVTRIGEITAVVGSVSRIFFQSHLWIVFAMVIAAFVLISYVRRKNSLKSRVLLIIMIVLSMSVILISYSRSFWLGLAMGLTISFSILLIKKLISFREFIGIAIGTCIVVALGLGINAFLIYLPLPGLSGELVNTGDLLVDRVTDLDEPAASSRFALLDPLIDTIRTRPIMGSGYGTTVTYQSVAPRALEVNNGVYTSFAFEWGYLDILTEVGLVGLAVIAYFMYRVFKFGIQVHQASQDDEERLFIIGLLSCLLILMCIHITTPFLNHPLGIFFVILCIQYFTVSSQAGSGGRLWKA